MHTVSTPTMAVLVVLGLLMAFMQVIDSSVGDHQTYTSYPPYVRGKNYIWVLNETDLSNSISYLGSHSRLRAAITKLKSGNKIKVATIGGSITAGQGAVDAPNWPQYLFNWLEDTYGKDIIEGSNGAVSGTLSAYMSVCLNMHITKDVDIVFVEYSVNDWHLPGGPPFQNEMRRSFERLLRKILTYPHKPAVILVHSYIWYQAYPVPGSFWNNAEREFNELALYYHLPSVSLKACCYQHLAAEVPGFEVKTPRYKDSAVLKYRSFYYDQMHPDGNTGARVIAEMAMHMIKTAEEWLQIRPMTDKEVANVALALPAPMIQGNREAMADKCFIGNSFTQTVILKQGFDWINEANGNPRPKWGFVATKEGSVLKLEVDTRASTQTGDTDEVLVEVAYLKSYENMGQAQVSCEAGCNCTPTTADGHQVERNSLLHLHNFYVTQAKECHIVVRVLPTTNSGKHKFKLAGIMISEEAGQKEGIKNNGAVEFVGDISLLSKDGKFDVKNQI
ncbi:hypothetical protein CEUSTIGMA_g9065.t1 [Chlamydomonas eustigma]|uniref:SGNH hydrolase-type esterase domain-containing protein n=1 Tax=Chlamydomonas eustigma TaxID=1157962 RepID=A0A250XEZ1_9CHLO|nr:hypothetical protein CEUSTIGMA_g9065.t1 [Chlamydomonas eustigma]|eukprot:GAX81637.1 hypothetical protein CEUSTIGMA_g9065.t1 [Chlamydomonas eustigma]